MDITRENIDALNTVLRVKVEKSDYEGKVDEVLRDTRKRARVDGFRPGKVPMGLIKKMYFTPVLVDEVNKLVSDALLNYLRENDIHILGEPLPRRDQEKRVDFQRDEEFEFAFDLGLAPKIDLEINGKDKIPWYRIKVDKKQLDEYKQSVLQRYGDFKPVEKAGKDEMIKGLLEEADGEGNPVEDGIRAENVSISLDMIKDEDQKLLFSGTGKGDEVIFDVKKAFPGDTELASLLKIDKSMIPRLEGTFKCVIEEVMKYEPAEPGQTLYDSLYGEGAVSSEEEFIQRLREEMERNYERESEYRFFFDAREYLIKKAKLDLPVEFLKRWMVETNENLTAAQVSEDFGKYEDDFRWQLIKEHLLKKHGIKVTEEEALETAKRVALNQYMQYGISNVPEDYLENYARQILSKPEESEKIYSQRAEDKLIGLIKSTARIDEKEVSLDKFRKLYEK
ncbi:MAG TPA: trigger factor [Bacteroides sp.]|nr:trigger factor [Bacteroides sp.]